MPLAYIRFIDEHTGRPIDPDYGVDEGVPGAPVRPDHGFNPDYPSQGLPPFPGRPGNRPPGSYPGRPGNRPPGSYPGRPDTGPVRPGRPTDPDYGIEESGSPEIWPIPPGGGGLPPIAGHPLPPVDPPPGTVWPPLPPIVPEGKVIALVAISGIGYRYTVLTVPPPIAGHPLPPTPGVPDNTLPTPPVATPKR